MKTYQKPILTTVSVAQEAIASQFGSRFDTFLGLDEGIQFNAITSYNRNSGANLT